MEALLSRSCYGVSTQSPSLGVSDPQTLRSISFSSRFQKISFKWVLVSFLLSFLMLLMDIVLALLNKKKPLFLWGLDQKPGFVIRLLKDTIFVRLVMVHATIAYIYAWCDELVWIRFNDWIGVLGFMSEEVLLLWFWWFFPLKLLSLDQRSNFYLCIKRGLFYQKKKDGNNLKLSGDPAKNAVFYSKLENPWLGLDSSCSVKKWLRESQHGGLGESFFLKYIKK